MINRSPSVRTAAVPRVLLWLLPLVVVIAGGTMAMPMEPVVNRATTAPRATATLTPQPTTIPQDANLSLTKHRAPIGPEFSSYYAAHKGSTWLGDALLPQVTTARGEEQIFQGGILRATNSGNGQVTTIATVAPLIGAGALMPLAGSDGDLTYASLAPATAIGQRVPAPWWWRPGSRAVISGIFVGQGTLADTTVGHYIPALFAAYLTGLGNWQALIGLPLTESLPLTTKVQGVVHNVILQAYERGVLFYDADANATPPKITAQFSGSDHLAIFGPPPAAGAKTRAAWTVNGTTTVQIGPGNPTTTATFQSAFPVTLTGDTIWLNDVLWEHIQWQNLNGARDGWVKSTQIDLTATKGSGPQTADLAAIAPQVNNLVQQGGGNVAVAVYIPEYDRLYTYNAGVQIDSASTIKVPILMALLKQAETQGRTLTADEDTLATAMIERSDNDAATLLYQAINYDTGLNAFLQSIGVSGITLNVDSFGYSLTTPVAMAQILNALWNGHVLNESDRQFALDLMSHVEPDQQMGIGSTAPTNATYAMKNGWIADTNGWVTNSIGIVTSGGHTYIITVYSQGHATLEGGWQSIEPICAAIAGALGAKP